MSWSGAATAWGTSAAALPRRQPAAVGLPGKAGFAVRQPFQQLSSAAQRRWAPPTLAADVADERRRWRQASAANGGSGGVPSLDSLGVVGPESQQPGVQQQQRGEGGYEQQTAAGPAAPDAAAQQQQQAAAATAAASAAAATGGSNGDGGDAAAQQPPPLWVKHLPGWQLPAVPWALNTTITLMVLWLVCFWLAAYSLVPALLHWAGVEPSGGATQALRHLLLDSLQVGATVLLLWRGLAGYQPRALGLFAAPLRPLRAWLPAVAAGLATFPFVDWVHKRMVALLALEDVMTASGTAEQILGTSSAATQGLWFAVLAVCAPIWEELMFRGFLLPSLARYLPKWGALAATSLLFGLVHFSREGLLPLLLLGCVFGGAYASTRNLLAPIALHSLWNVCLLVQLLRTGAGT